SIALGKARKSLSAIERSTWWLAGAPVRKLLSPYPFLRRWFGRVAKLMFWSISLQLTRRLTERKASIAKQKEKQKTKQKPKQKPEPKVHRQLPAPREVRPHWNCPSGQVRVQEQIGTKFEPTPAKKIIFVTPELSRTGAPLILRELVAAIAKSRQYELITLAAKGGPLLNNFRLYSHVVEGFDEEAVEDLIANIRSSTIIAFCNTANVNPYAKVLSTWGIPVVTLVHEMAYRYNVEYFKAI